MSPERFPNPANGTESEKRTEFQNRLAEIIYTPLTVENINTFADKALNELVELTNEVTTYYKSETLSNREGRELEDEAYSIYGLENIGEVLSKIQEKIAQIKSIFVFIENKTEKTEDVLTPPDDQQEFPVTIGGEQFERKRLFPRLATLLYIIENDFYIPKEETLIVQGETTDQMMRQKPYFRIQLNELNRLVYICDEEGNASYVFDKELLDENQIEYHSLDVMTKEEKNDLISKFSKVGHRLIQTKNWRGNMSRLLRDEITSQETEEKDITDTIEAKSSEFITRELRTYLPFSEFQEEVKSSYSLSNSKNVSAWYQKERFNHENWPATPRRFYKDKGWIGWPELVGKESRLKKEYLEFNDFCKNVRAVYSGEVNIFQWYRNNREKYGWPSNPNEYYKDNGWTGWQDMVEKKRISLEDFKTVVRSLYPKGNVGVVRWYKEEQKKHADWPSSPERYYAPYWKGWFETVGIGNPRSMEFRGKLNFNVFSTEVKSLYPGEGNVRAWYIIEKDKHPNWPADPSNIYRHDGWCGWSELVGKTNPLKKEFLGFNDFESEVKRSYSGEVNIQKWYATEYRKHPNWPAAPFQFYKDKGWKNWTDLVGKEI